MKFILIVMMINGSQYQWESFSSEVEVNAYKTRLFDWNRKKGNTLRDRGFDIPFVWSEYNKRVFIIKQ